MTRFIIGTYAGAGGPGLIPAVLDGDRLCTDGAPVASIANASMGVRYGGRWYVVDEPAGCIAVHAGSKGGWKLLGSVASGGDAACHLAIRDGLLAVANYASGTATLFRLDDAGLPTRPRVHQFAGSGPDPDRQAGPHAHWVGFEGNRLLIADLGADCIHAIPIDGSAPVDAYVAPPGSGPRQIAFHPRLPVAFLVSELASTLTVLDIGPRLSARATVSTLPSGVSGSLGGAIAISPAGDHLYVSNRGHDSVAAFAVDAAGDVALLGHCPTDGRSPRFMLLLAAERRLLVAHEQEGGVTLIGLDGNGLPYPMPARLDAPGACFLATLENP